MALFGKSIRDKELKKIETLLQAALTEAQKGYDEAREIRRTAYVYRSPKNEWGRANFRNRC